VAILAKEREKDKTEKKARGKESWSCISYVVGGWRGEQGSFFRMHMT